MLGFFFIIYSYLSKKKLFYQINQTKLEINLLMAKKYIMKKKTVKVVVIIGDGSIDRSVARRVNA
jgi:hypothetical protein